MSQIDNIKNNVYAQAGLKEIQIKGNRYTISLLPAYTAFAVSSDLIKLVAPSIASFIDSGRKEDYILPEEDSMFSEMAMLLVRQMDQVNLVTIVKSLLEGLTCNGVPVDPNEHFKGNFSGFLSIVEYALKENFGDFFTEYLKEKGLEIHSLREALTQNQAKDSIQDKSEQE